MEDCRREYRYRAGMTIVLLLGIVLRLWGLSGTALTGDEIASAISASNYMEGGSLGPTMWNHPNLRNLLLYWDLSSGLTSFWSIRGISLLLGSLTPLFLGLVARQISGSTSAALMAAFMLAVDPLHIDFSRQAVHEVYMACFSLAGVWFALLFLRQNRMLPLIGAGICFGLGISSKWEPVFPLAVMMFFAMRHAMTGEEAERRDIVAQAAFVAACLVAIPLVVYLCTWLPWFLQGKDMSDWLLLHREMFRETTSHAGYNAYNYTISFRAWQWFVKPVEFVDVIFGAQRVNVLIGISNAAVWCLVLPSLAYMMFHAFKRRDERYWMVTSLFLLSYIPFVATSRPIWAHSAFTVLCFGIVMISVTLVTISPPAHSKKIAVSYLTIVALLSAPLYLLATGQGEDFSLLRPLVARYRPANER